LVVGGNGFGVAEGVAVGSADGGIKTVTTTTSGVEVGGSGVSVGAVVAVTTFSTTRTVGPDVGDGGGGVAVGSGRAVAVGVATCAGFMAREPEEVGRFRPKAR